MMRFLPCLLIFVLAVAAAQDDDDNDFGDDDDDAVEYDVTPPQHQQQQQQQQPNMAPGEAFPPDTLRCLVCQAVVDEFTDSIAAVDPKKKIEAKAGRMDAKGNTNSKVVTYARSEIHLTELIESVCKEFEEYVQGRDKVTHDVTIIRIMSKSGGMNPQFGEVDIVPDDDLNKRLKFYCEYIVENYEDDLLRIFSKSGETKAAGVKELCVKTKMCKKKQLWKRLRDEL
jgi:hypothetical protein